MGLPSWGAKGFATIPIRRVAPRQGLTVYRCWGGTSLESGPFFAREMPTSVIDAEMRFNIADWGNRITFVTTFRLQPGTVYWEGPVAHNPGDLHRGARQIFVAPPVGRKARPGARRVLRHDAFVAPRTGNA